MDNNDKILKYAVPVGVRKGRFILFKDHYTKGIFKQLPLLMAQVDGKSWFAWAQASAQVCASGE